MMIVIVLLCTVLGVCGIWGLVDGDTAWQIFWTLCVVAIGLGTATFMIEIYFKDTYSLTGIVKNIKDDVLESMDGKKSDSK